MNQPVLKPLGGAEKGKCCAGWSEVGSSCRGSEQDVRAWAGEEGPLSGGHWSRDSEPAEQGKGAPHEAPGVGVRAWV